MPRWIPGLVLVLGLCSTASAQEQEPNNVCASAPDAGALALPAQVTGSLDAVDATNLTDVDFYRFTAEPGLRLRVRVSESADVALFGPNCRTRQGTGFGTLDFTVPETGVVTLAVAVRDDGLFLGFGSRNTGAYLLQLELQPPFIGTLTGRLTDAETGAPLVGDLFGSPRVELRRCDMNACQEPPIGSSNVDGLGRFQIMSTRERPIEAGTFRLTASAPDHASRSVDVAIARDQNVDVGDIALPPPEIELVDIMPCTEIAPQGGTCEYSLRILNNTERPLLGTAFSRVRSSRNVFDQSPSFEAGTRAGDPDVRRAALAVPPFSSSVAAFAFDVPSFVPNGTRICADVYVGVAPSPLLDVRKSTEVFCLLKGTYGFALQASAQPAEATLSAVTSEPTLELEPNNSCAMAQDAGVATVETALAGSLDAKDATARTDVDFFRFTAEPGLRLTVEVPFSQGVRRLGVFDERCEPREVSSRAPVLVDFDVPASGVFVLAVADAGDQAFDGNGSFSEEAYDLLFRPQPPLVGSITGRLVDARSRRPLTGRASSTSVSLTVRNDGGGGISPFAFADVNADGTFRIARDSYGRRLQLYDTYRIDAFVPEYGPTSVEIRPQRDADIDLGDIALRPPPVQFENLVPCAALPPAGGSCAYSVDVVNNTSLPLQGTAFSSVQSGSDFFTQTFFEATGEGSGADVVRPRVDIAANGSATVRFAFDVAPTNGPVAQLPLCVRLSLGYEPSPLFDTARSEPLFCLQQSKTGFAVTLGGPPQP